MSTIPDKLLSGRTREYRIEYLIKSAPIDPTASLKRRLLCWVLPPWQRLEVWDIDRKRRFIEGLFLGLGTGYYVEHEPDWSGEGTRPTSGWLIDGQQRLTAIRDFVHHGLQIFDGVTYADLDQVTLRRRFWNVPFPCFEVEYQNNELMLRELYERLNFGGVTHTEQDRGRLNLPPAGDRQRG